MHENEISFNCGKTDYAKKNLKDNAIKKQESKQKQKQQQKIHNQNYNPCKLFKSW